MKHNLLYSSKLELAKIWVGIFLVVKTLYGKYRTNYYTFQKRGHELLHPVSSENDASTHYKFLLKMTSMPDRVLTEFIHEGLTPYGNSWFLSFF